MSEERWRSVPWQHGASWERARSVGRTAEKHIRNVVPGTESVTEACGKRRGRHGTLQGRFRSVTETCEEMVEGFGSVRGVPKSDMKR